MTRMEQYPKKSKTARDAARLGNFSPNKMKRQESSGSRPMQPTPTVNALSAREGILP